MGKVWLMVRCCTWSANMAGEDLDVGSSYIPTIIIDNIFAKLFTQFAQYTILIEEFALISMLKILGDSLSHITRQFSICHVFLHLFHLCAISCNKFNPWLMMIPHIRWPTLTVSVYVCKCVCVSVLPGGQVWIGVQCTFISPNWQATNTVTQHGATKVNQFSAVLFINHNLPFRGIVFGWNLNFELNLSHDLKIMHSKWHQISSRASSTTCRWAIVVGIYQNRQFRKFNCSKFWEFMFRHCITMGDLPAISYAQHVWHCFE